MLLLRKTTGYLGVRSTLRAGRIKEKELVTKPQDIDSFTNEKQCTLKDETFSARDNGAIMRLQKSEGRKRTEDNAWTFGRLNAKTGFLELGGQRVHQVVAAAFHGLAPKPTDVVVHLDTDRRNNRVENLFWVSRFENTLLTPHNCEKIRKICGGSVASLLEDISIAQKSNLPVQFAWIANISQTEASATIARLLELAEADTKSKVISLDEWLEHRWEGSNRFAEGKAIDRSPRKPSLTDNCVQVGWRVPSEFPLCPQGIVDDPLDDYYANLVEGQIFCRNRTYEKCVVEKAISDDRKSILVISGTPEGQESVKPWALAKIEYEGRAFLHYNLGSFFEVIGAEKYFCLAQGKEWNGGDCFDDFC